MPKRRSISRAEIEADLELIALVLMKLDNPEARYWVTVVVDRVVEGYLTACTGAGVERTGDDPARQDQDRQDPGTQSREPAHT